MLDATNTRVASWKKENGFTNSQVDEQFSQVEILEQLVDLIDQLVELLCQLAHLFATRNLELATCNSQLATCNWCNDDDDGKILSQVKWEVDRDSR